MFKIGFGNDIHRLEVGRKLILGGVPIPSEKGAVGHSDADALLHAITDALLGSLALGDIGSHFSDRDEKWKDADSAVFLRSAIELVRAEQFEIENIDSIITIEQPKIKPYISEIRENVSNVLKISVDRISVKAKTHEGLDSVGLGGAVKAEAVILIGRSN